jgi:hypothetical protein
VAGWAAVTGSIGDLDGRRRLAAWDGRRRLAARDGRRWLAARDEMAAAVLGLGGSAG